MSQGDNIEQLAALWVAREDRGLAFRESEELAVWLDENALHRVAYLRLKTVWNRSARLVALKGASEFACRVSRPFFKPVLAMAAACLTIAGLAFVCLHGLQRQKVYTASIGQRPSVRLSDGTQIQLNANTVIRTRMTAKTRIVTLDKGEAYFDVVHDAARPFEVLVGNKRIYDIGTKFAVERHGDDVRVVVTEGRVRVDTIGAPSQAVPVYASGGDMVVAKADETLVASQSAQEVSDDLGWRRGLLIFHGKTLADAAEQFNRYNVRQLVVVGAARDIRIGGSFRADNMDAFAALVHESLGLAITYAPDQITLSK